MLQHEEGGSRSIWMENGVELMTKINGVEYMYERISKDSALGSS